MFANLLGNLGSIVNLIGSIVPGDVTIDGTEGVTTITQVLTTQDLQPVGDAMVSAATAAVPVGLAVMAVTSGIPIAKKVIKQLGR